MDFEEGARIVSHCYAARVRKRADEQRIVLRFEKGRN
jgi:hypothetical protein